MLFMKVEMSSTQKGAMPLSFSGFDIFDDLQGQFGRFVNLALYKENSETQQQRFIAQAASVQGPKNHQKDPGLVRRHLILLNN